MKSKFDGIIPNEFVGVVSVKQKEEILFNQVSGFADFPNQIQNDFETKFATASAGKAFVACGILKLIEQQRLNFDSCIGNILDFDLREIDPQITIQQLLNHTSGIPDYFDEEVMSDYAELFINYPNYKIRTSMDLVPLFINKPMMYPKGEKFQYNNTGYVVLGLVIEKISSLPFDRFLETAVFEPCGMKDTGYFELDRLPANCANAYIYDETRQDYYTNIYSVDVKGTGAGGAFITVPDVEKFWNGLFSEKIISKEFVLQMLSPQVDEQCYGYGFWLKRDNDDTFIPYFQGSDPGVSFISSFDVEKQISITLVSNFGHNVWSLNKVICNVLA